VQRHMAHAEDLWGGGCEGIHCDGDTRCTTVFIISMCLHYDFKYFYMMCGVFVDNCQCRYQSEVVVVTKIHEQHNICHD
jgi:hypothetical protein